MSQKRQTIKKTLGLSPVFFRALANWGVDLPRAMAYHPGWRCALPWAISLSPVGANDPVMVRCSKKLGDCPRFFSGVRYHGPKEIVQKPVGQLLSPAKLQRKHACSAGSRGERPFRSGKAARRSRERRSMTLAPQPCSACRVRMSFPISK